MSFVKIGKIFTDKHKFNLARSKSGENNPWFGKSRSEETRKKISSANIGKEVSEETRQRMSVSKIGKPRSENTKQKISVALRGENGPNAKLSNNQRLEIIEKRKIKVPIKTLMEEYGVSKQTIIRVAKNTDRNKE